ncbi:MAG: hypothetical protein MUF42_07595 [Cytophagaceae bacterium]|jgi:hypothetical protein|nr:hypothetical protein [Cytophagaceae bacterium]
MRILAMIFILVVVYLSVRPCDHYHGPDSTIDDQQEMCSPFCTCSHTGILPAASLSWEPLLMHHFMETKVSFFLFDDFFISNNYLSIWQPPKLV